MKISIFIIFGICILIMYTINIIALVKELKTIIKNDKKQQFYCIFFVLRIFLHLF